MRLDAHVTASRACWAVAIGILGLTFFCVVEPSEAKLVALKERSRILESQLVADEAAANNIGRLAVAQRDITRELEGVNLQTDRVGLVALFLKDVERLAHGESIALISVQNELSSANGPARSEPFDAVVLDLTLQGKYDAILRTVADLSRARVLTRVDETSIDRASGEVRRVPTLSMQVKVTIFYLRPLQGR